MSSPKQVFECIERNMSSFICERTIFGVVAVVDFCSGTSTTGENRGVIGLLFCQHHQGQGKGGYIGKAYSGLGSGFIDRLSFCSVGRTD